MKMLLAHGCGFHHYPCWRPCWYREVVYPGFFARIGFHHGGSGLLWIFLIFVALLLLCAILRDSGRSESKDK
ncbi:MAG: hypothetical protein ABSD29_16815 [Verrucomicrobiota bacterium]